MRAVIFDWLGEDKVLLVGSSGDSDEFQPIVSRSSKVGTPLSKVTSLKTLWIFEDELRKCVRFLERANKAKSSRRVFNIRSAKTELPSCR